MEAGRFSKTRGKTGKFTAMEVFLFSIRFYVVIWLNISAPFNYTAIKINENYGQSYFILQFIIYTILSNFA